MKGARCAYTMDQGFGNLLLLERHLQVTHSVIRNRHHPEGLSPHPKAGVVTKEVMMSADGVSKAGEMYFTFTHIDTLQWP